MRKLSILHGFLLLFSTSLFSQDSHSEKTKYVKFCGYKFKDTAAIQRDLESNILFLKINNGDTVIDVGTSSGNYIGALNAIGSFTNVHFILVDIDSNCLNQVKVNNMISYYQGLRGSPFNNTFSVVVNTPDSLYLPLKRYKKLLIINTLHEIDDKEKMAKQLAAVLQPGGELIVGELSPEGKRTIHQGCNKPLMSPDEIINLFNRFGFKFLEKENVEPGWHKHKRPVYLIRLTKM